MAAFFESFKVKDDRAFNYKIQTIAKDTQSGFLEIVFEDIETLSKTLQAKIPKSYFALNDARNAFVCADLNDHKASDNFQEAIFTILKENNHHTNTDQLEWNM
jgi:hypothetical protein